MSIGKIAQKIHDAMTSRYGSLKDNVLIAGVALGALGSGVAGYDWTHEEWDNGLTENTIQVTEVFNQRAKDLRSLSEKLDIVEDSRDLAERKLGKRWTIDTPEFKQYAIESKGYEEQLEFKSQRYVTDVLLNGDITEKTAEKLMQNFKDSGLENYGASFPNSDLAYAFKESQNMFKNEENLTDHQKSALIKAEIQGNKDDSVGVMFGLPGMLLGGFGVTGLAGIAGSVANRSQRRRKKPSIKRN